MRIKGVEKSITHHYKTINKQKYGYKLIYLNTERGFERVENWQEITELVGFTSNLDPEQETLKEIIGSYKFNYEIPCGLSCCHTLHMKGFIGVTDTGKVTNIGKNCGKSRFGLDFELFSKIHDKELNTYIYKGTISSFLSQSDDFESQIFDIRNNLNADAYYKTSRALITPNKGCPSEIVSLIRKMIKTQNNTIYKEREASKREVEELEVATGQKIPTPHIIQESYESLDGLSFLYKNNDLRDLLIKDLNQNLQAIKKSNIEKLSFNELKYWSSWCNSFEKSIETSEIILSSGKKLLDKNNLSKLSIILEDKKDSVLFNKFLSSLPK